MKPVKEKNQVFEILKAGQKITHDSAYEHVNGTVVGYSNGYIVVDE